jgi:diguanylate cyclase (GGDEF)-like protein
MVMAMVAALIILVTVSGIVGLYAVGVIDAAALRSERLRADAAVVAAQRQHQPADQATADEIGQLTDLHNAHFGTSADVGPTQAAAGVPLASGRGGPMQFLIWTPQRYGSMAFDQTGPIRIVSTTLWVLVIVFILFRLKDFTERVEAARRVARELAARDSLTGLANRMSFEQRIKAELATSLRAGRQLALLYLDLDGFKQVNDSLGHAAGDWLLKAVADRLRSETRPGSLIARLGGDEFAIIATEGSPVTAARFAARLHRALAEPYRMDDGRTVVAGASIGMAIAPGHGRTPEELLAHADAALYLAKGRPRARFVIYRPDRPTAETEIDTGLAA